ncbi:MAG: WxL domain-containing protein [Thermoleophilia bacterium]|nr:WxL domain-containing protein [Thermoleophilia bacterium]
MHRTSLRLGAALIAAAALAFPASALAATATPTGTVTAGSLSLTTTAAPTFSTTLNGTDQTPTYPLPLTIEDLTGTGAGWNTTITSTEFTTGGETPHTLSTTASSMTGVTNACVEGAACTDPTNAIAYPLSVPAGAIAPAAVKFFNAAAETGMGVFTNTPTVGVSIPADTYAGTYTSTITLASVSGP